MKPRVKIVLAGLVVVGCLAFAGRTQAADVGPRPGVWILKYEGPTGSKWVGRVVLKRLGDITYSGHTDWESADRTNQGREFIEAIYDPRTKVITVVGKSLKVERGTVIAGTYSAVVSDDGEKMFDGTWSTGDETAAKWVAFRKR